MLRRTKKRENRNQKQKKTGEFRRHLRPMHTSPLKNPKWTAVAFNSHGKRKPSATIIVIVIANIRTWSRNIAGKWKRAFSLPVRGALFARRPCCRARVFPAFFDGFVIPEYYLGFRRFVDVYRAKFPVARYANTKISAILREIFTRGSENFMRINKSVKFNKLYLFRNLCKHESDLGCEFRKNNLCLFHFGWKGKINFSWL